MSQSQQTFPESISGKEPWLAVNLSAVFPGIGQIYSGNAYRGCLVIIAYVLFAGFGLGLLLLPAGNIASAFGLLLGSVLLNIWNLFDAHGCARRANSTSFEQLRKSGKDPWLAVFLSRIIPGLGHLYSGKILTGIVFLIGFFIFLVFLH